MLGTQRDLYSTCLLWGLALGVTQIFVFALGVTHIFAFLDTNMLVSPTRNSSIGGPDQHDPPTREVCVAVEYRLKRFTSGSVRAGMSNLSVGSPG